jgi:RNA polymerase sigma-70 factor (ECF subfamily)
VLRFLHHRGLEPDQAEDVAQETLVAAWRHAGTFESEDARPWLLTIARNAAARHFRRRAGEPDGFLPLDNLALEAGWGAGPEEDLLGRLAARDALVRAFERLTPDEREILSLRDLEGYAGAEAAEVLGISLVAQKSRLHRARLRLMAELRGESNDAR